MFPTAKSPPSKFYHTVRRIAWPLRTRRAPIIRSLDPELLQTSDFVDPSNLTQPSFIAELQDGRRIRGRIFYATKDRKLTPFPAETHGFLYCHRDPRLPPTTTEIRFRVTKSPDPVYFESGTDLMRPDGALPWSIPLLQLRKLHTPLKHLVVQDGVIRPEILGCMGRYIWGVFLTFLEQPFIITLEKFCYITVIDSELRVKASHLRILLPIDGKSRKSVFKGKLLVRFERASLTEHVNDTSIVMRVLKVVEPIQPLVEDVPQPVPEAGTLLKSMIYGQVRCMEFKAPFLKFLPSITATSSLQSSNPKLIKDRLTRLVAVATRSIGTLDPHRLQPSDFMIVSNKSNFHLYRRDNPLQAPPSTVAYQPPFGLFPPNTQGFLYMHLKPGLPILTGQIRFRVMPSNDPTQFDKGTDLRDLRGQIWKLNALHIASGELTHVKEQLYHDGYVEFVQAVSELPQRGHGRKQLQRMLFYLEQPFVVDLRFRSYSLTLISSKQILYARHRNTFVDDRCSLSPYTGRIVLRFERSPLPEHANGNFVVLRVLKILDPIKPIDPHYDGHVPVPRVGELLTENDSSVHSCNIDIKPTALGISGLKSLPSVPDDEPDLESFQ